MKTLTADEFKTLVENDPAWASTLTKPVQITGYCDMEYSHITHLSSFLRFTGREDRGNYANFSGCKVLKVAEGTFDGFVCFATSGIEKIGELVVTKPENNGNAAGFESCKNLKVAEGIFAGFVNFEDSAIERIENLNITRPDHGGDAVYFRYCENLKIAEGNFPGRASFYKSGITRIGNLIITKPSNAGTAVDFEGCYNLTLPKIWLGRTDITTDEDLRTRSQIQLQYEAAARKAMKQPTFEL